MSPFVVTTAVEGDSDVPMVERIVTHVGGEMGSPYVQRGKDRLDLNLSGYNNAARRAHWFVLRDLNGDEPCAPSLVTRLLPNPSELMRFRVAVHAAEAWLMADAERMADFLSVARSRMPGAPDDIADPKGFLVNLARRSRDRRIRNDMVPRAGTTARVGPGYTARIIEFTLGAWRPEVAANTSPSLARCLRAVEALVTTPYPAS
jgi:hypothetical protein